MEKNERNPDWKPQKERIKEITDQLYVMKLEDLISETRQWKNK